MKNKWRNYALKTGKIEASYIREYINRKKVRQAGEASNSNCHVEGRKEQEKVVLPVEVKTKKKRKTKKQLEINFT